jgi:hypothetical protein
MIPSCEDCMAEEKPKPINLRLSEKADNLLRKSLRRKGDLTRRFHDAVLSANWDEVEVVTRRKTYQAFMETSIPMEPELYEKLKECARKRGVEISALIDALIIAYYSHDQHRDD